MVKVDFAVTQNACHQVGRLAGNYIAFLLEGCVLEIFNGDHTLLSPLPSSTKLCQCKNSPFRGFIAPHLHQIRKIYPKIGEARKAIVKHPKTLQWRTLGQLD